MLSLERWLASLTFIVWTQSLIDLVTCFAGLNLSNDGMMVGERRALFLDDLLASLAELNLSNEDGRTVGWRRPLFFDDMLFCLADPSTS